MPRRKNAIGEQVFVAALLGLGSQPLSRSQRVLQLPRADQALHFRQKHQPHRAAVNLSRGGFTLGRFVGERGKRFPGPQEAALHASTAHPVDVALRHQPGDLQQSLHFVPLDRPRLARQQRQPVVERTSASRWANSRIASCPASSSARAACSGNPPAS